MVLEMASSILAKRINSLPGFVKLLAPIAGAGVVRSWAGGYVCQEDRLLHDKIFILVGGFSGPGLALFRQLALRGCQVIALHPTPSDPSIFQLMLLLRETSRNERLYAEECDVCSISSIRAFVKRWDRDARKGMVGDLKARIEALVFCDGEGSGLEGVGIGLPQQLIPTLDGTPLDLHHASLLLSRHALIQLLLPNLLSSSQESPVRIILQLSPFYAASPLLDPANLNLDFQSPAPNSYHPYTPWIAEGQASLASLSLLREFQERVDTTRAAAASNESATDGSAGIVCLAACSGFTRSYFRKILRADWNHESFSWVGFVAWLVILPVLWLFAKNAEEGAQDLLLAVLGSGAKAAVPMVGGEEDLNAVEEKAKEQEGKKVKRDEGEPKVRLRAGCLYRDGKEVRVAQLEEAGPKLGPALWAIESKRVERLVALAEAGEKEASAKKSEKEE
ncbi:hypothetical protein P7C70_g7682, partial [Phenoliferia sp. Uapishka_3]